MPKFTYVGSRGEHIVGIEPGDLTEEQYDALDYDHQQAVYINRGSDGGPIYQEVPEAPETLEPVAEPEPAPEPAPAEAAPESVPIPDASLPAVEPTEGAN